ncbi:GTP-binding protein Rho1 [Tulasnella sp. 330]|nr:GTP-binding protein Rho1 [Tulasnella sp. 330]
MHSVYQTIELNKARLADLLQRCRRVIGAIDQHTKSPPSRDNDNGVKQLLRHLRFIESLVGVLAQLGFMKTLLRRDEISGQIVECHQRLSDCLVVFQINAARDLRDYVTGLQEARNADEEFMKQQFAMLNANDVVLMQKFDLLQNQVEAMAALHQNLHQKLDKSIERRILQAVLMALQRSTGKTIDSKSPSWTITSFDVDIDHSETIGRGGFAVVKKGKWGKLLVAVKEMTNITDTELLLKEIKVWKRLRHNHVLPFYGASLMASPPFLVSRYMKNGNITKYLTAINPGANRVQLAHEIALGMLYIHERNIIHGDLKGVNVLIDDSGLACITDFGLSKIKLHATSTHTVAQIPTPGDGSAHIAGTLRYMSPEAMTGTCNKACDVYSYAMTLEFMLYFLIAKEQKRLDEPTDAEVVDRGLTSAMWSLIWNASDPVPALRYNFTSICNVTEGLVEEWDEVLARECTTREAAKSVKAAPSAEVANQSIGDNESIIATSATPSPQHTSSVSTDIAAVDYVLPSLDSNFVTEESATSESQRTDDHITPMTLRHVAKPPRPLPKIPTQANPLVSSATDVSSLPVRHPIQQPNRNRPSLPALPTAGYAPISNAAHVSLLRSHVPSGSTDSIHSISSDFGEIRQDSRYSGGYGQYQPYSPPVDPSSAQPESPASDLYGSHSASNSQMTGYPTRSYSPDIPSFSEFQPLALKIEKRSNTTVPPASLSSYGEPSQLVLDPAREQTSSTAVEPSVFLPSYRDNYGDQRPGLSSFADPSKWREGSTHTERRKLVVVGDGCSGKTALLFAYAMGYFYDVYHSTMFDNYLANVQVDGVNVELGLWHTPGQEDYDRLRPLSYPESHVILITFAIDSPDSLDNVLEKWISEVMHFAAGVPIILVGCKRELRRDPQTIDYLRKVGQRPVTPEEGMIVSQKIGAKHYLECSAKTGEGITEVFQYAARCALRAGKKDKNKDCIIV